MTTYYDQYAHVAPGRTLAELLDYSDEDDSDEGGLDVRYTKQGTAFVVPPANPSAGVTAGLGASSHTNRQGESTSLGKFQPAQHKNVDRSVLNRIHIENFRDAERGAGGGARKANEKVVNEMCDATLSNRAARHAGPKEVDRSERATVENVMDPRTRLLLYKLVNSNILREIHGCVSTGKEANVYYAVSGDGSQSAVKVYKTSILAFKDRDKYVAGEFRFQRYCKSNPRKMVRTWAEKEARNLSRLQEGGVLAPAVKLLRQHILIMEFLGEDGWPAPRLKEVKFPSLAALDRCYLDLCCTIRIMFTRAKLIHGDLSEYNLLFYRGRVVVIDVSQSVEQDHPLAMDFLRRDLVNVTRFFRAQGHRELFSLRDLFIFVTTVEHGTGWARVTGPDPTEQCMQHLLEMREEKRNSETNMNGEGSGLDDEEQAKVDEQVFLSINVPRNLTAFSDTKAPNVEMMPFLQQMIADEKRDGEEEEQEEEEGEGEEDEENAEGAARHHIDPTVCLADMTKEEKKQHKKDVKEAQRQRRVEKKKNKMAGKKSKPTKK